MKWLLVAAVCILPFCLSAQATDYKFMRYDIRDGVSHNSANCFWQDRQGFLWIGTRSGLNCFDGHSFKVFHNDLHDTTSLASDAIASMSEDPDGRIWINHTDFFSIYDPMTERFYRNADAQARAYGLPDAQLTKFLRTKTGAFWVNHTTLGLCRYNAADRRFHQINQLPLDTTTLSVGQIADYQEDTNTGRLWVVHRNGIVECLDPTTQRVVFRSRYLSDLYANQSLGYRLFVDADGDVWFYFGTMKGAHYLNTATQMFYPVNTSATKFRLNNNIVRAISQDTEGSVWIATDHGGINLMDKKSQTVRYLCNKTDDDRSLSEDATIALFRDLSGTMWVGTFKNGFNSYHKNVFKFPLYRHSTDPNSLPFSDVNRFVEDAKGNIWIGTNGGGLVYFDRKTGKFTQYRNHPNDPNSLSNDVIVSLFIDRQQRLWIGTYFGGLNCFDGHTFTRYMHNVHNPNSIADDRVWAIFEDSQQNFWVGTLGGGLDLFDREHKTFRHLTPNDGSAISHNSVMSFLEDRNGNLWVSTTHGIDVLEKSTGHFTHYKSDLQRRGSLSNNTVNNIIEDADGHIWAATQHGLNLFDRKNETFRVFGKEDGLPDNHILALVEDNQRGLWLVTTKGLVNFKVITWAADEVKNFTIRTYTELDGLQGREFNELAGYKAKDGTLYFGGANGFNVVPSGKIATNEGKPTILLTDFQIFNRSIRPQEVVDGRIVLQKSMTQTHEITLEHSQNVFSIEFTALDFAPSESDNFYYILEGFNNQWFAADKNTRRATYTNLDAGDYTFRVRVGSENGEPSPPQSPRRGGNISEGILKIHVLPPWWATRTAYFFYFLSFFGGLFLARWLLLDRERMNFRLEQERQDARRTHELDMMKIKFLTNISHEFRTPLTLILTPLEKILTAKKESNEKTQLALMYRNAKRLLNFVNQLLDFKKLEIEETQFVATHGDIVAFVRDLAQSFSDLTEKKNLVFTFETGVESLYMDFDQEKLARVMYNLLSNAVKFTPDGGAFGVTLRQIEATAALEIRVSDTGIGIPLAAQIRVFDRFFQQTLPNSMTNQGSGIGLSITKEFVNLHGGTIHVESTPHEGSTFMVRLPIRKAGDMMNFAEGTPSVSTPQMDIFLEKTLVSNEDLSLSNAESITAPMDEIPTEIVAAKPKPTVLLVEDNAEFRTYLTYALQAQFTILTAENGKIALKMLLIEQPDLVVSDVMMPEMDGMELCRRIKTDLRVSHIPVILLTARTAEDQQLRGYKTGADAYVTKPFRFDMLLAMIHNLIRQRARFQRQFQEHIVVKPSDISITSLDEKLIKRAIEIVEEHIADADFSVENLSHQLTMSRVYLYKKLLALTGKTPIEFIRIIRLKRAAQLLEKSQLTIAEIAYKVGFNNPKYFAKYFKEEFGQLPTAYQKNFQ